MHLERPDVDALGAILRDPTARFDERDDAAMYLGKSDEPAAIRLLLGLARDPSEDDVVVASSGESLAQIAVRTGRLDPGWLENLRPEALAEILPWVRRECPGLLPESLRN